MIRVACVLKSGGGYLPAHVHALQAACKRWLPEHDFVCLTDIPEQVGCRTERLTTEARGWWAKMELFRVFQGPTLYLDLDTIIRADAGAMLRVIGTEEFVVLRDFYRGARDAKAMQSSVMAWSGNMQWLWQIWQDQGMRSELRGDQDFLEESFAKSGRPVTYWQDVAPGLMCSFKAGIRDAVDKSKAPVVCFHGNPRPWEQGLVPYLPSPIPFDQNVVVVGNGPSLLRQKLGKVIDSFDNVVRINSFDTHGFEEFTGRVTTHHATHGKSGGRREGYSCDRTIWLHGHEAWGTRESWSVPKSFYWGLVLPWAPDRSILPSAGFVTVAWLLDQGSLVVHLAGFDHFGKSRSGLHHYWDGVAKTQPKEHAPNKEQATFEDWRQQGRVSYL